MDLIADTRRVWIPNHPTEGYVPGEVAERGDDGVLIVVDETGEQFKLAEKDAQSVDPACLTGVDDLLHLGDFNEAALLHNIRVRYAEDRIYTGIGSPILISVNPYQNIASLYSSACQLEYRRAGAARAAGAKGGPPTHLYTVADAAYRTMLNEQVNQSIIISGESGAGKTEATKRVLAYLAEMQKTSSAAKSGDNRTIEQQVLDANPVLEAFGNAKTVRNDNSSRFGKFVEVEFDSAGRLLSAQISNYLLEKCRIVSQQPDERNYHIFYQLCAGISTIPSLASKLQLKPSSDFEYSCGCTDIDGVDDLAEFSTMVTCMTSLGFSSEERDSVLKMVGAVLHLGELPFSKCQREGQEGVEVDDIGKAELICDLLGLETQRLQEVLEHKTLEDKLSKKKIRMNNDVQSAVQARHSVAKVLYARLFDWLVWKINESMAGQTGSKKDLRRIGLLDIYGFEVFDWNSFEQLCINFANEKLQQHFNSHMFALEQRLYSSEGIAWSHITFQDNLPIIESLEKRPLGLFCLIDSECVMPSATDLTLHGKILKNFTASKIIYKPSRFACSDFAVMHYAGEVVYSVETFLEKNTDKLHNDIIELLKGSKVDVVQVLFNDPRFAPELKGSETKAGPRDRSSGAQMRRQKTMDLENRQKTNVTVGMMFREQLDKLVADLDKTNPRYVRCIKPNANKQPREFDSIDVLRQLRCAGMLESIRIRRAGYAVRRPFKEFFTRFRTLVPHLTAGRQDPDYRALCNKLCTEVEQRLRRDQVALEEKSWQMGQTRLFMKEELERHFERLLVESAKQHVISMQRRWRGYLQRKRFLAIRASAVHVQASLRTALAVVRYREAKRRNDAAIKLQAALRELACRAVFCRQRRAAICIQRRVRGWRCRSRLGKLKSAAAAEKIRKLRLEQEREEELQKAREEAREKEQAMEEMRRQLEENQRREQEPPPPPVERPTITRITKENQELQERLAAAEAAAAAAAEAEARREQEPPPPPVERPTIVRITNENRELQDRLAAAEDLSQQNRDLQERVAAADALTHKNKELLERLAAAEAAAAAAAAAASANAETEAASQRRPAGAKGAMDTLRSEILARIGGGGSGSLDDTGVLEHTLSSALRQKEEPSPMMTSPMASALRPIDSSSALNFAMQGSMVKGVEEDMPLSGRLSVEGGRKSLICQRDMFEKLKRQFAEAQGALNNAKDVGDEEVEIPLETFEIAEQLKSLEEEVRKLRRENAELKTIELVAREECAEASNELSSLTEQISHLKAELQDVRYRHKSDTQDLRQQLEETLGMLHQNTEDMQRMRQRTRSAEDRASSLDGQTQIAESELRARQEQIARLEKENADMNQLLAQLQKERAEYLNRTNMTAEELDRTLHMTKLDEQKHYQERDQLQKTLSARENELTNVKQLLDDVMGNHVPAEEMLKWKNRAEAYEQEYKKAARVNLEVTSVVGHMTQGASERSKDLYELQQRVQILQKNLEKRDQEISMRDLEKEDLQKQLENLQSSCDYFQKKYKATASELRSLQKDHAQLDDSLSKSRAHAMTMAPVAEVHQNLKPPPQAHHQNGMAGMTAQQQQQQQQQQQMMLTQEQWNLARAGYPVPGYMPDRRYAQR